MPSGSAIEASQAAARDGADDRRSHARLPPSELEWIREVRLKYGPRVALLDLSPGGALLQTAVQLRPGTELALEIVGRGIEIIPLRVLRCQLATIAQEGALYRGACAFKRPLNLPSGRAPAPRADAALGQLLARRRLELTTAASQGARGRPDRTLPYQLRALQATLRARDPLSRAVCDILGDLIPALLRGEAAAVLQARVEGHLRQAAPELTRATAAATTAFPADADAGCPPGAGLVSVRLSGGGELPDWQFQLLQAASCLSELLPTEPRRPAIPDPDASSPGAPGATERTAISGPPAVPAADINAGWQKIVVRYREGRLLKGFTHDFHPSRTQFSLWPSISAAPAERVHIPTSQLKAVFFVRDFDGNPDRSDARTFDRAQAGRRLEVTFADDEVLVGTTLSYRSDGIGFFVNPADRGANNLRVFVVASAIRHVRFP